MKDKETIRSAAQLESGVIATGINQIIGELEEIAAERFSQHHVVYLHRERELFNSGHSSVEVIKKRVGARFDCEDWFTPEEIMQASQRAAQNGATETTS